jgi:spore coat protein CotH
VKKLSLNNNHFDKTYLRDVLSYKLCNDFGLAAPKTAFAKLFVKTSERTSPTFIGLYTATEVVDEAFLKRRFGTREGLLMKPTGAGFMRARDWSAIERQAVPKTQATDAEKARLLSFVKLVREGSETEFAREIESYINLDNYLRFIVVNVALANLDSYLAMGKNYYLYLNPKTGKLVWIPFRPLLWRVLSVRHARAADAFEH